jgi:hypothetical protein
MHEYSEFRCYSPMKDCQVTRISMQSPKGVYWQEIDGLEGKAYREAKEAAINDLVEAIETGLHPGKITRCPM